MAPPRKQEPPRASLPSPLPPAMDFTTGDNDDPLASILGPGSGTTLLGKADDEIPDEILAIFTEHGLHGKKFRVMLKQMDDSGSDDGNLPFVKSWTRSIPSLDFIAREYGPGKYQLVFSWKERVNGRQENTTENMMLTISDKRMGEYKDYQFNKKIEEVNARRGKLQDMKIDGKIDESLDPLLGEARKPEIPIEQAAMQYVENITTMAGKLGLGRQGGGIDWDKIIALATIAVPAILSNLSASRERMAAENRQQLTMMMGLMTQNNQQLVEVMKTQQPAKGADLTKEMFDMIRGAIDVKEMINDRGKESIADRIFNLLVTLGPQLLEFAKLSAQQRQTNPMVQAAKMYVKSNPEMQEAAHNPQEARELYLKVDESFGWRQADIILGEVGGVPRPPECPRRPEQELPIDQRGSTGGATRESPVPQRIAAEEEGEYEDNPMGVQG